MLLMSEPRTFWSEPSVRVRFQEKITSSAVKSLPLWNFTPLRSLKTQVVGDVVSQDSASAGISSRFAL